MGSSGFKWNSDRVIVIVKEKWFRCNGPDWASQQLYTSRRCVGGDDL